MLLQRLHQDRLGHLQALVQALELLAAAVAIVAAVCSSRERVGGYGQEGAVEVVDAFDKVAGKSRDGEVPRGLHVALGAVLQVAEVGDGAEVAVLDLGGIWVSGRVGCVLGKGGVV